jgi:methyltransferase family protein
VRKEELSISMLMSAPIIRNVARMFSRQRDRDIRACILSQIPSNAVCAEIGVYKGDFSELILEHAPKKLHLVDPWMFEVDLAYAGSWYGGTLGKSQAKMNTIYKSVISRFRFEIRSEVVEVHRNTSAKACSQFPDNYFDWIYVDGNHLYEFVKLDLEMFLPKVKVRGLVAGDDYGSPGWWQDGVTKAVDEAVASGRFDKLLIENHQFLLRKL